MELNLETGIVVNAEFIKSPNYDDRPFLGLENQHRAQPEAIIIHCISLPPGEYGGGQIARFFQNKLRKEEHPYFQSMASLTVSAHFLIERTGRLVQFVPTDKRAWHAGESVCMERPRVNDFSIGIELEGLDTDAAGFTVAQYQRLSELVLCMKNAYPRITENSIFAHSDIAPGRKPDPGAFFEWPALLEMIDNLSA